MTDWPTWATEAVHLQPADPDWAPRGEAGRRALADVLAPWLAGPVDHVGSTAVPGLLAKPVLDYQAVVRDLADADEIAPVLAPAGWHLVPPVLDDRPYRRFFVQAADDHRVAHLHLLLPGSEAAAAQLAFRDALRADAGLAADYGALKQSLLVRHGDDREAYTEAKTAFVARVLSSSGTGPGHLTEHPA